MTATTKLLQMGAAGAGGESTYVEDVFSTYIYTGNGTGQIIQNGIELSGGNTGGGGLFDGTGDYLQINDNAAFNLGTSNYTMEFWCFPTSFANSAAPFSYQWDTSGGTRLIVFVQETNGTLQVFYNDASYDLITTSTVTLNAWNHIALVRNTNTFTLYINGVAAAAETQAGMSYPDNDDPIIIGGTWSGTAGNSFNYAGYISNVRVVIGTAVYTGNFTPPTSPLTAISGTVLLTCQGDTPFVDNSPNAFAISQYGNVTATSIGPFTDPEIGYGGMVWFKDRTTANDNNLFDTSRGAGYRLISNATNTSQLASGTLTSFNSNGFSVGSAGGSTNRSGGSLVSWTFRKAEKFFDVVTYTGDGAVSKNISHNLGSVPGCIIVKCTSTTHPWRVYHRSLGNTKALALNSTDSEYTNSTFWNNTTPTSTVFTVGESAFLNQSGQTYVAYLFAHNAGGFGLSGADNIITCGSYTGNGSSDGPSITLGYEPQWLLIKNSAGSVEDWILIDDMRGFLTGGVDQVLKPNLSNIESEFTYAEPTPTGFKLRNSSGAVNQASATYIYIAIRRGPMAPPTTGTEIFTPTARAGSTGSAILVSGTNVPDVALIANRTAVTEKFVLASRLTGGKYILTNATYSEQLQLDSTLVANTFNFSQLGFRVGTAIDNDYTNTSSDTYINYAWSRAPGFMDVVCYTGTGTAQNINHNLTAVPEMMWVKKRSGAGGIVVYTATTGNASRLNMADNTAATGSTTWNSTTPTSSVFTVGANTDTNESGATFIAWLFASVPGVSKVGTYTGNNNLNTITTGFSPRFIMIKRTNSTGNWYVYDTARGIISGNDPYLFLDTTAAEVTSTNYISVSSTGFVLNNAPAALNALASTFIYLAIA